MLAPEAAAQPGSRAASRQSQYGEAAEADDGGGETNMAAAETVALQGGGDDNHKTDSEDNEDSNDEEVNCDCVCCGYVYYCAALSLTTHVLR
jgi:hypothetical protein